jgi:hypothetical protein
VQLPPEPLAFTGGKLEDFSTRARDWRERSEKLKARSEEDGRARDAQVRAVGETRQQLEGAQGGDQRGSPRSLSRCEIDPRRCASGRNSPAGFASWKPSWR